MRGGCLGIYCTDNPKSVNIKPIMSDELVAKMRTMSEEQVREILIKCLAN